MELVFIIFISLIFFFLSIFLGSIQEEQRKKEELEEEMKQIKKELGHKDDKCPPHYWSYHPVTNQLTCTKCNYVAGSD